MGQLGMGVMINMLSGGPDNSAAAAAVGKVIQSAAIVENELIFRFVDGTAIAVYDDGQSCCESRYMSCDDDLPYYEGATLMDAEVADGPTVEDDYDCHEQQFLKVTTSKGVFTVVNHNEHNGYYGGFCLASKVLP